VDEAAMKTLEVSKQSSAQGKPQGKYNCYTGKQRAQIGKEWAYQSCKAFCCTVESGYE